MRFKFILFPSKVINKFVILVGMIYYDPAKVLSPRDCIDNVKVLYDGGFKTNIYSLAIVTWQGQDHIGIRWNVNQREWDNAAKKAKKATCIGEPSSRGYPTWFILPTDYFRFYLAVRVRLLI